MSEIIKRIPLEGSAGQGAAGRQKKLASLMEKEAAVRALAASRQGLRRLIAAISDPLKTHLDYVGISRKMLMTEQISQGQIIYHDTDIEEYLAIIVGPNGTSRQIVITGDRVFPTEVEIVVRPKIHRKELEIRTFRVFERMKERLKQAFQLREDLQFLSLLDTAVATSGNTVTVAGNLTPNAIAQAFEKIESNRLVVPHIILNAKGIYGLRVQNNTAIDEAARIELRKTGYLGTLFGASFYLTDQITETGAGNNTTYAYVVTNKELLGTMSFRVDADVTPADNVDNNLVGLVGYELLAWYIHNTNGVSRVEFVRT